MSQHRELLAGHPQRREGCNGADIIRWYRIHLVRVYVHGRKPSAAPHVHVDGVEHHGRVYTGSISTHSHHSGIEISIATMTGPTERGGIDASHSRP